MGKVGIVTFHEAINYGAVMQAYALKQAIGDSAEIIPYRSKHIYNGYNLCRRFFKSSFKGKVAFILDENISAFKKKKKFIKFRREYLGIGKTFVEKEKMCDICADYDVIVTGSDQVFNLDCTGNDFTYFLDFVPLNCKRVSYAASFGSCSIDDKFSEKIKDCLLNFNYLSVRECAGQEIIEKLIGKKSKLVLDPTLLIDRACWERLATEPKSRISYVFVYMIQYDRDLLLFAKKIAGKERKVIYVGPGARNNLKGIKRVVACGPQEWLGYIKNADVVVTNAFHGIALSLSLMKQVFIGLPPYSKPTDNDRIYNIISMFDLENRLYSGADLISNINYDKVNIKMSEMKRDSLNFLSESVLKYINNKETNNGIE